MSGSASVMCTCASIKPGITYFPPKSRTCASFGAGLLPLGYTAVMRSPSIAMVMSRCTAEPVPSISPTCVSSSGLGAAASAGNANRHSNSGRMRFMEPSPKDPPRINGNASGPASCHAQPNGCVSSIAALTCNFMVACACQRRPDELEYRPHRKAGLVESPARTRVARAQRSGAVRHVVWRPLRWSVRRGRAADRKNRADPGRRRSRRDADALRRHAVRMDRRTDRADATHRVPLAPVRHRQGHRLLARTDDADRVRAARRARWHPADRHRIGLRQAAAGAPCESLRSERRRLDAPDAVDPEISGPAMTPKMRKPRSSIALHAPVFAALGDPTRLRLVAALCAGGALSIAQLTTGTAITRQAVTKHLEVLAEAGLVRDVRQGRERLWELEPSRIGEARRALDFISEQWDQALQRLKALVEK